MVVEQPVFNPFDPEFAANPFPVLAHFREHEPVHLSPFGTWILFGYDDVLRVLRDPTLSVEDGNADIPPALRNAEREALVGERSGGSRAMLNLDPPDHHRLRRLVAKVFTPRVVENLRPRAQQALRRSRRATRSAAIPKRSTSSATSRSRSPSPSSPTCSACPRARTA